MRSNSSVVRVAGLLLVAIAMAAGGGYVHVRAQTQPPAHGDKSHGKMVDPEINAQFKNADVQKFVKRFEAEDREVFAKRLPITKALHLRSGMTAADIGAGTGVFTRLIADEVGPGGKVYAVDISSSFLDHIAAESKRLGQKQVTTIRGTQDSTNLPPNSIDLAFLCDVYHHLEHHEAVLASIHRALKPGGRLVLVEFDRVEGKSSEFVLKHIRTGQKQFRREIQAAGFRPVDMDDAPKLKENFLAAFVREEHRPAKAGKPATRGEQ